MQINKETLNDFRSHMIKAAKEFGVDLDMGRITYAEGSKENEFKRGASKFGFSSMWYNSSFMYQSKLPMKSSTRYANTTDIKTQI